MLNKILIITLLMCINCLAQSSNPNSNINLHTIGFRIEPFLFLSKTNGTGFYAYKHKDEEGIYLTSFNLSYRYMLSEILSLNTRVGYLWTNEDRFNGFEAGEIIRLDIKNNPFLLVGIIFHFNTEDFVREFHIKNVVIPLIIVGTGYNLSKEFNLELQYNIPLNREYKTSTFNGPVFYKLTGLLKLSIGFEFSL